MKDSRFRGKNIGGDAWLGGDNFDYLLMDLVAEHIAERYNGYDPRSDEMFRSRIKPRVEEAKQALSEADRTVINIPILGKAPPAPGQTSPRILAVRNLTVTREQFEAMIDDCIQKSLAEVDAVLAERNIKPETVSEVLLIGGSTYIPKVRASMEAKFPGRVRNVEDVHPMYAVAQGAAYYAAALTGLICEKCKTVNPDGTAACEKCGADLGAGRAVLNPELMDTRQITDRSIGIGVKKGAERDVFHVIIPKATPYPMETPITHNFIATKPNQVFIRVWAGANEKASRNSHQGNIVVDLKGREVTIGTPVKVGMRYDDNRVLELSVAIEGREPELHRLEYGSTIDDAIESLDEAIRRAKHFCDEYDEYMSDRQRLTLQKHMQLGQDALDGRNERQAERTAESINKQIYFSDTLASLMHTAERLVHDSRIKQNIRNQLRQLVMVAKEAHEMKDEAGVLSIRKDLEVANAVDGQRGYVLGHRQSAGIPAAGGICRFTVECVFGRHAEHVARLLNLSFIEHRDGTWRETRAACLDGRWLSLSQIASAAADRRTQLESVAAIEVAPQQRFMLNLSGSSYLLQLDDHVALATPFGIAAGDSLEAVPALAFNKGGAAVRAEPSGSPLIRHYTVTNGADRPVMLRIVRLDM